MSFFYQPRICTHNLVNVWGLAYIATERSMMKPSKVLNADPSPPTSTSASTWRHSHVYYTKCKLSNKNREGEQDSRYWLKWHTEHTPVSNVMSSFPGLRTSDSWNRIFPGTSMSNRCIWRVIDTADAICKCWYGARRTRNMLMEQTYKYLPKKAYLIQSLCKNLVRFRVLVVVLYSTYLWHWVLLEWTRTSSQSPFDQR